MGPFVVLGVGSVNLARPVDGVAEAFGLFAEVGDIILSDVLRGGAGLDGVILSGETEGIVAEGP